MLLQPASQVAHSKVLRWGLAALNGMNYGPFLLSIFRVQMQPH